MVFDLKNKINTQFINSPIDSLVISSDTSEEDQFANPGTSKANNGSFHSIKSNNKSEYNRNLLSDYARDQGLMGRLGGKSGNLEEVDHRDDLGTTKNSILVNYLGRGKNQWKVQDHGGIKQFKSNNEDTRLTKGIWNNEFGEQRDTKFASNTHRNPTNLEPIPIVEKNEPKRDLSKEKK